MRVYRVEAETYCAWSACCEEQKGKAKGSYSMASNKSSCSKPQMLFALILYCTYYSSKNRLGQILPRMTGAVMFFRVNSVSTAPHRRSVIHACLGFCVPATQWKMCIFKTKAIGLTLTPSRQKAPAFAPPAWHKCTCTSFFLGLQYITKWKVTGAGVRRLLFHLPSIHSLFTLLLFVPNHPSLTLQLHFSMACCYCPFHQ